MRLGIDTGGTYTDAVLYDDRVGVVASKKSLTTHQDLSIGIKDVIDKIDSEEYPLSKIVKFTAISTTLATNSIVEDRGGTVCLLLIGYSSDALKRSNLKSALRGDPVEFINGGHTASGDEQQPLDIDTAKQCILHHASSVSAFAVAGMFSVRNSSHEIAVRDLIIELTQKPVTCTVELTSQLDAPRRAMTSVLNARLIAPISSLIRTVQSELRLRKVNSPLMVVNGDGSMMSAELAITRPVETILSGPAASITGMCQLAENNISIVADIGGTTTDIAILKNGKPNITPQGAQVGGFNTFIKAVDVHTIGLGGDSEVSFTRPLRVGPARALPISSLAFQYPEITTILERQLAQKPSEFQGCFALRRSKATYIKSLSRSSQKLWGLLKTGPVNCEELFREPRMLNAFYRLRQLDMVQLSTFTPTDALHALGIVERWCTTSANLAAELWVRGFVRNENSPWRGKAEFCNRVLEKVVEGSCEIITKAAIATEFPDEPIQDLGRLLLKKGISNKTTGSMNVEFTLSGKLGVIGAPARAIYPEVAQRLNANLETPTHAEVGNAVGAAAGNVNQSVAGLITSPAEGVYRTHTPYGVKDFNKLEESAKHAIKELQSIARERAKTANTNQLTPTVNRKDIVVPAIGGSSIFVESRIEVTVTGDLNLD